MYPEYEQPNGPVVSDPLGSEPRFRLKLPQLSPRLWIVIAAGVVLLGGIVAFVLLRGNGGESAEPPVAISPVVVYVGIDASGYTPTTVKLKKGQEVTWTNKDVKPHRLIADPETLQSFDSVEPLNQGDSYTYIFDKSGTFRYYDPDAPQTYTGTVTVE